jgi:copper(I)-binding protein
MLLLASCAAAQAAPFDVTDAWFRSLPGKLPAGGYFTAQNNTNREVAITGVQSDACGMLMMHQSSSKGGMSGMDMVDKVTLPPGGQVKFAPGGYHLMCDAPKLKIGTKAPVSIMLSNGTTVVVAFQVRGAAGK